MRQIGRDFEADEAILPIRLVIDRTQEVGDGANIMNDHGFVDVVGVLALFDELVHLLIVGLARANRFLEYGGVGGDADDAVFIQKAFELARDEL